MGLAASPSYHTEVFCLRLGHRSEVEETISQNVKIYLGQPGHPADPCFGSDLQTPRPTSSRNYSWSGSPRLEGPLSLDYGLPENGQDWVLSQSSQQRSPFLLLLDVELRSGLPLPPELTWPPLPTLN